MELILIPLLSAALAYGAGQQLNRSLAFALSLVPGLVALAFGVHSIDVPWFSDDIRLALNPSGWSNLMLLLTNFLVPVIVLAGWREGEKFSLQVALTLFMQAALNGVFMAQDGLTFYIFWELALIPIYFLALLFSEGDRFAVTLKFFLYTFLGSLTMLASLMYLYSLTSVGDDGHHSFAYSALQAVELSTTEGFWVGLGLFLAFAVKIPLMPFHAWQSDTYTQAPAGATMLLSGIMLKMGLYGLFVWFVALAPESLHYMLVDDLFDFRDLIMVMGLAGLLYGAFIAMRQSDAKRLIAFSSLSHVGLIAMAMLTLKSDGVNGAVLQMWVHGVNAVGLFLVVDLIERRLGHRDLEQMGGFAKSSPFFAATALIIVLGTVAVPLTNGFPGEFLMLKAVFNTGTGYCGVLAALTIIFCAVYMLRFFQLAFMGPEKGSLSSLEWNEKLALLIIGAAVLYTGVQPQIILDMVQSNTDSWLNAIAESGGILS